MQQFKTLDNTVEVRGAAVMSIVDGVPAAFTETAKEILADHGIEELDPDEWYPQQAYLDAYQQIVDDIGESTLRRIGESTPENAEWPPGVSTPFEALASIDDAYNMNHRGGDIGYYDVKRVDETTAHVECKTPYPCEYDQALVEATAEQFAEGVVRLREVGEQCRADGGDHCVYEVTW